MPSPKMPRLRTLVARVLTETSVLAHPDCPFSYHLEAGDARVVVLAGDNASGKSLLAQAVAACAYKHHQIEPMVASMATRAGGGMGAAMVYGSEGHSATNILSVAAARTALTSIPGRLKFHHAALAILDEPDIGLSEGYAQAFGQVLAEHIKALPDANWAVLLITHSRPLVRSLVEHLGVRPTFVHAGPKSTLEHWLTHVPQHSVEELLSLQEQGHVRFRQVRGLMDEPAAAPAARPKPPRPRSKP